MERYRIEVGHVHSVKPGNIVGAIANEAGIDAEFIGRIDIYDDFSTVDLPEGMPRELVRILKKTQISGNALKICRFEEAFNGKRNGGFKGRSKNGRAPKGKKKFVRN